MTFDPHAMEGKTNARYSRSWQILCFGSPENYVDLGEDYAVILHELGHGIHDWITGGNLSNNEGLSEGSADYWSQSYTRSLGYSKPGDSQYDQFVLWGGQPAWNGSCLRVTNYQGHYPEDLTGNIHIDGQMWSSSLMSIYDRIGKDATDRLFLETLSMLGRGANQRDAANAFIQADKDLYNGEHLDVITDVFISRGYLKSIITFRSDVQTGHAPLSVQFSDSLINDQVRINSWEWDFDNDGIVDSYAPDPKWTYNQAGEYSVFLKVSDGIKEYEFSREHYIQVFNGESALAFSGKDSYVYCQTDNKLNLSNAFTAKAWIKPNGWGSKKDCSARIISKLNLFLSLVGKENRRFSKNSVVLYLRLEGSNHCYFNSEPNSIKLDKWQHIAVTYNSITSETRIYIDGIEQSLTIYGKVSGEIANNELYPLVIGNSKYGTRGFEGVIDEVRVWRRALTYEEIHYDNWNQENPDEIGLVAYFPMNEGNGNTVIDLSGLNLIGTTVKTNWVSGYSSSDPTEIQESNWNELPLKFELQPNFPNPFNPKTVIGYRLSKLSDVDLSIYNLLGQKVATLISERQPAGSYQVEWNASEFSSGVYFYVITAGEFHEVRKMMLIK